MQAALKEAIQQVYQLEPSELAVLPIPDRDRQWGLLLYEAAEGGAGVLRLLVDDPLALQQLAREALKVCHFDPETGEDLGAEVCGAACYDCLLDYANQPDHELLNRHTIQPLLQQLSRAEVRPASAGRPRADHLSSLKEKCDSQLERKWLDTLEQLRLRLPSHAQFFIESCLTRPDFFYQDVRVAIFVDGPPHDEDLVASNDREITDRLEAAGYLVLRFHHTEDWAAKLKKYPDIFGGGA